MRGSLAAAVSAALPALPATSEFVVDNKLLEPVRMNVADWAARHRIEDFQTAYPRAIARSFAMPYDCLIVDSNPGDTTFERCRKMFVDSNPEPYRSALRMLHKNVTGIGKTIWMDPGRGEFITEDSVVGFDARDGSRDKVPRGPDRRGTLPAPLRLQEAKP